MPPDRRQVRLTLGVAQPLSHFKVQVQRKGGMKGDFADA